MHRQQQCCVLVYITLINIFYFLKQNVCLRYIFFICRDGLV